MALTFRSNQSDALSINELDNNFRHFTGSHEISGSITLTEGGNSSTLLSTDIAAFKEGKFAVGSSKSRGGSTNYAILNSVFNEADSNTKMDLATSGVIADSIITNLCRQWNLNIMSKYTHDDWYLLILPIKEESKHHHTLSKV